MDAVLSALGYKPSRGTLSSRIVLAAILAGLVGVAAWRFWPASARSQARAWHQPGTTPAPAPAPAPPESSTERSQARGWLQPGAPARSQPRGWLRRGAARAPEAADEEEFARALYYQRTGDFEQALLHYKAALQRDEMDVEAHNNLGYLYLDKGLLDEAAREFQRVVAIEPRYATAHINLSATLLRMGRIDGAAAEAREALRIDPRSDDALVNLALAQKAAGQPGEAQTTLRRALEINTHNAAAHYNLARQFEDAGEAILAVDHYRQFLQYAGPEQEAYAQDVRARLQTLLTRIK